MRTPSVKHQIESPKKSKKMHCDESDCRHHEVSEQRSFSATELSRKAEGPKVVQVRHVSVNEKQFPTIKVFSCKKKSITIFYIR